MSDALAKVVDVLADLSEAEAAAILSSLGARDSRGPQRATAPGTPFPAPQECPHIRSEIEWV